VGPDYVYLKDGSKKMLIESLAEKMAEKYPDNIVIVREEAFSAPPVASFLEQEITKPIETFEAKGVLDDSLPEPVRESLECDGRCHGITQAGTRCRIKIPVGELFCSRHKIE